MTNTTDEKKQCQALKLNRERCIREARVGSKYCKQHRFSRFGDAHWYNIKIQAHVALAAILLAVIGIVATVVFGLFGATESNQDRNLAEIEKLRNDIQKAMGQLGPAIPEDIKLAIENLFLGILREEKAIPPSQWPEKLLEIAKRHRELLEKWQAVQLGDPAVDKLKDESHRMIELGDYDKAERILQQAIEINRKALLAKQEKLDERKLSTAQLFADRADIAKARLEYKGAIELYKEALDILPRNRKTAQARFLNNLGLLYLTVADYKEAEHLMQRALAIFIEFTRRTGHPHPYLDYGINNYAALLKEMGHSEAEIAARLKRLAPEMFESSDNQTKEE